MAMIFIIRVVSFTRSFGLLMKHFVGGRPRHPLKDNPDRGVRHGVFYGARRCINCCGKIALVPTLPRGGMSLAPGMLLRVTQRRVVPDN